MDLPAEDERREIFAIHLARRNRPPGKFDLDLLASVSEGFSGAEIEQSVIEAMFSVYGIKSDIETADLVLALKRMVPLSRTMGRSISERRMWAIGRTVSASSASDMQESLEQAEIQVKYERYIEKEQEIVAKMSQLENMPIPASFDYDRVSALSNEALQKFKKIRPATLGQASRISGVNPSDVQILMVFMGR